VTKPSPVVIRKYGNRRLYDPSRSRYVNLDDIAQMIRDGRDVQVVDARTGHNITRLILTQIITEDAKDKPTLPLELLRQLIVASDEVRREFVTWYLKSALDTYQKVQDAVQSRLGEVGSALSPVEMMKRFLGGVASPPQHPAEESELEVLRRRISELEARIQHNRQGKRRSPKKHGRGYNRRAKLH
jgi:polyhydroxyalkanoate synthesis repressor PhaR